MSGERTDRDIEYKLQAKRLAWREGYVPLLNAAIRSSDSVGQVATDADVLGWRFNPDGSVAIFLADCRDTTTNAVERVLWVKGLAAFFGATEVVLLKKRIPTNARWMAERIGVRCIDDRVLVNVDLHYRLGELKGPYFDLAGVAACDLTALRFSKGSDYRRVATFLAHDVLPLQPFERVNSLMELFASHEIARTLQPSDRTHCVLVWTACVIFGLALGEVLGGLRAHDFGNFPAALRAALAGGQAQYLAKSQVAAKLLKFKGVALDAKVAPLDAPSFPRLMESAVRFAARRSSFNEALRQLDVARHYVAVGREVPERVGGEGAEAELGRKYARDILDLFLDSNGLDRGFATPLDLARAGGGQQRRDSEVHESRSVSPTPTTEPPLTLFEMPEPPAGSTTPGDASNIVREELE